MRRYELMLVLRPDVPEDRIQAVLDRSTRAISAAGGQIVKVSPWGRRRLAYPIDSFREGSYYILVFEAPSEAVAELERGLNITEEVMRHLVTRVERPAAPPRRVGRATTMTSSARRPNDEELDDDGEFIDESESEAAPAADRLILLIQLAEEAQAMSLNKCMIIGNLGRDPEMRYTPSGQAVTQFTVATNRNYRDQNQEWQKETEWFRVVVWGQQAERAAENLRKGNKVYVEGRIQTRQWEDQTGQKRYTTELVANQVSSLERRERGDEEAPFPERLPAASRGAPAPARPRAAVRRASLAASDRRPSGEDYDDLPF